jgi:membrane protein DedA with SNARE-associated domain
MTHWLTQHVSGSDLTYLVVAAAAGLDVILPLIPSETVVITASVLAARGGLVIWLIVVCTAAGAFVGDNAVYFLGSRVGDPVARRLFRGERGRARLEWAERAVRRRGPALIVHGRFIPGGRTAGTFASGTLQLAYRRFVPADALAAALWACYASALGYFGGETFKDNLWFSVGFPFAAAATFSLAGEAWRRRQRRRGKDFMGDELG